MNELDIILMIPLLWGLIRGFLKGFIIQLAGIAAFLLGVTGAIHFSAFVSGFMEHKLGWHSPHASLIAFGITFIGIVLLVFLLARLMEKAVKVTALGIFNKIAGALFGALKFILIAGAILYLISILENSFRMIPPKTQETSLLYKFYLESFKILVPAIRNIN